MKRPGIRVTFPDSCLTGLSIPATKALPPGKNCRCCENHPEKQAACHCHQDHPAVNLGLEAGRALARRKEQEVIAKVFKEVS